MEAFIDIRRKAREKRDRIINTARREYEETLVRIAALEQDLLGREVSTYKKLSACIERVLPTDREFTTVDVMTGLEALDGGRVWRKRSVDNYITRLRERGLVKRLRKSRKNQPAIYARVGVEVAPRPFEGMTLRDVLAKFVAEKPRTTTELTVALLEANYDTITPRAEFRRRVGVVLRQNGYRMVGGKWEAA